MADKPEAVNHPSHYGGADDPYETIKVIDAWGLGFALGNAVKYISRAGKKDPSKTVEDLKKAEFYIRHEIERLEASATSNGRIVTSRRDMTPLEQAIATIVEAERNDRAPYRRTHRQGAFP